MRIFDLYVLRQTLKPLCIALVIALLVLLIERMLRLLDLVLGASGPLQMVFEIMAFLVPHYIGLALPISLLLGVMIAFNRLNRDGEIDAMQGAGMSLMHQSRSALIVAVVVAIVTGITLGYLKPFGRYAYQSMVYAVSNAAFETLVRPGVFAEVGNTTFLVHDIEPDGGSFGRIFLFEDKGEGTSTTITARDGVLMRSSDEAPPLLRLSEGIRLNIRASEAQQRADAPDAPPVGVLRFQQLRMALSGESSGVFRTRGVDERELTLNELWERRHEPPPGIRVSDMLAELNVRLARALSVPFLPLLGIPLALGRRRSDRSYGLAVGMLCLIIYNQVLDLGKNIAETGEIDPLIGIWLPCLIFVGISGWLFYRASMRLPQSAGPGLPSLWPPLVRLASAARAQFGRSR
ncbi:MAG: LptF/LptG family permease [Rhodospirillales bacterium]|nr:LptF/LptG family permease [Rhodospirillales bacterium]